MITTSKIFKLQVKLNSKNYLPAKAFRRNVSIYELVCYVNIITGCLLSENIKPIGVFIERCRSYMASNQDPSYLKYFSLVNDYLTEIENTLIGEE